VGFTKLDDAFASSSIFSLGLPAVGFWAYLMSQADARGVVRATVPDMAARCRVSPEDVERFLELLQQPDRWSRTPDNEGRRVEVVRDPEWAVVLLNHGKYRERDHTAAQRMKDRRQRIGSGWDERASAQGYRCGCCHEEFRTPYSRFVVQDHDHGKEHLGERGSFRALVCQSCNKLIGQLEHGRSVGTKAALVEAYLSRYGRDTRDVTPQPVTSRKQKTEAEAETEAGRKEPPPALPPADQAERAIRQSTDALRTRLYGLITEMVAADPEHADPTELMRMVTAYDKPDGSRVKGVVNASLLTHERLEHSIADAEEQLAEWRAASGTATTRKA
jgi:hypothetical protein